MIRYTSIQIDDTHDNICLLACLLACLFCFVLFCFVLFCLFVCLFVGLFVCLFVCLFIFMISWNMFYYVVSITFNFCVYNH